MSSANTIGAVVVFDGGNPRTFTALAKTNITAGEFVKIDGDAGVVSSGADTYAAGDLLATPITDSLTCNGVALKTVESGTSNYVTIATRGSYLMRTSEVVSGGALVSAISGTLHSVGNIALVSGASGAVVFTAAPIGRAQANSASGTALYNLISLNL